jgi:type II secretory pathway pseudopilin PulG
MVRFSTSRREGSESGYILLTLMLFTALLAIAAAAAAPAIAFQVKRDREEELIHRGVQYSRAIKRYFKKFGRYPARLEDLENTNQLRFLRKRYKDPITGKDFKLLHPGDVQLTGGSQIAGATPVNQLANQGFAAGPAAIAASQPTQQNANQQAGTNASTGQNSNSGDNNSDDDKLSGKTFGGGPILGVASTSKDRTIREFNKKNHYNDWQFIYDPSTDRGGLLNTPAQPPLQGSVTNVQNVPGVAGTAIPNQNQNQFGNQTFQQPQQPQQPQLTPQPPQ